MANGPFVTGTKATLGVGVGLLIIAAVLGTVGYAGAKWEQRREKKAKEKRAASEAA
jgi:hypothetical protein